MLSHSFHCQHNYNNYILTKLNVYRIMNTCNKKRTQLNHEGLVIRDY